MTDPVAHLRCRCQRWRPEPRALCGTPVDRLVDAAPNDPRLFEATGDGPWCAVCIDLARTALIAARCERCAR